MMCGKRRLIAALIGIAVVLALAALPLLDKPYWTTFVFGALIAYVLAQSWDWVAGEMGYINLGHYAFYGVGAYAFSIALTSAVPVAAAIVIALAVVAAVAAVLAVPLFRLRGDYFAFATLALLPLAEVLAHNLDWLTGGADGVILPVARVLTIAYWLGLGTAVISFLVTLAINRARFGYALRGIRNDEEVAEVLGLHLLPTKTRALVLSAVFAAAAGAVQAWQMSYIAPSSVFGLNIALVPIAMALLGGTGLRWGPLAGVVVLSGIQQWLLVSVRMLQATIYGAIILLIGRFMPGGILRVRIFRSWSWLAPLAREHGEHFARNLLSPALTKAAPTLPIPRGGSEDKPVLVCEGVVKAFGGNIALNHVSFSVGPGEIVGLIGQNGSGKTTLFNCISKVHRLTAGDICVTGVSLRSLRRDQMALTGVGRTYQIPRPFGDLTVAENVAIPLMLGATRLSPRQALIEAHAFLAFAELDHRSRERADRLLLQEKKALEFARALATHPKLLLVDEIASGLTPIEVKRFAARIRDVRDSYGITVIWVEHIAAALAEAADRILVLDQGSLIADGSPREVFRDERVLANYLGKAEAV